jgi:Peptidase propeptide and YPEB domain
MPMLGRSSTSFAGVSAFNQLNRRCTGRRQISPTLEYFGSEVVEQFMSTKNTVILTLVLCFGAFAIAQAKPTDAELINQAKVKKNEAQRIALKQTPQGTIKSAEIENERGKLVWSFDISTVGTRDITEVLVDANTGAIVSVAKETPKQQAAEAKAEKQ